MEVDMPDELIEKKPPMLPPKLTARRVSPGATPVAQVAASAPTLPPAVVPPVSAAPATPVAAIKPVAVPSPISQPVPVIRLGTIPAAGIAADRKKDTSKLSINDAVPTADQGKPEAQAGVRTIRMKRPGAFAGGVARPPGSKPSPVPAPGGVAAMQAGIKSAMKSQTSRIDLGAVFAPPEPVGSVQPAGGEGRTVRVKRGPSPQASTVTQSVIVAPPAALTSPASGLVAATMQVIPADGADEATKTAATGPATGATMGPATIRLKRPDGLKPGDMAQRGGETARISIEGSAAPSSGVTSEPDAGPRTVKIRRPGDASAGGESPVTAGPVTGRKTLKLSRPGVDAPPAEAEDQQPLTQRRTISVKRDQAGVSERSQRLADDEAALRGQPGDMRITSIAERPERALWASLVSMAAMIIICVVIWLFCVQLMPTKESLTWPGRLLTFNDPFFKGEREWL